MSRIATHLCRVSPPQNWKKFKKYLSCLKELRMTVGPTGVSSLRITLSCARLKDSVLQSLRSMLCAAQCYATAPPSWRSCGVAGLHQWCIEWSSREIPCDRCGPQAVQPERVETNDIHRWRRAQTVQRAANGHQCNPFADEILASFFSIFFTPLLIWQLLRIFLAPTSYLDHPWVFMCNCNASGG